MRQVVDAEATREFMKETLDRADADELSGICAEVAEKSAFFQQALGPRSLPALTREDWRSLLRRVFSTRRRAEEAIERFGPGALRRWTAELLHGDGDIRTRLQGFLDRLDGWPEGVRCDFACELLHFARPERYWLWTRWIWDPKTRTGALPLLTTASCDLTGETAGEIYLKVGRATAFVHKLGEMAGLQAIGNSVFGTDVFLGCVYAVYAYTVLRLRMTKEFNTVMPHLPELTRRLLGVYHRRRPSPATQGA